MRRTPLEPASEEIHFQSNPSQMHLRQKLIKNCRFCGKHHEARKCPAFGKTCNKCSKSNHFAAVCRSFATKIAAMHHTVDDGNAKAELDDLYFSTPPSSVALTESVVIDNRAVRMQVDTGATVSVISSKMWKEWGEPKLVKCQRRLEAYDGHVLTTLGKFSAVLERNGIMHPVHLVVVQSEKDFGLLGQDILNVSQVSFSHAISHIDPLPIIKGIVARMELVEGAKDMFCRARRVPIALEEKISHELDRLEQRGIITKVIGGANNASPVVWVRKRNGDLRMCVDFKAHVNSKIKWETYPTPAPEVIFAKLKNAKKFAKLGLTEAYSQIELDNDAKRLSIINTSKGLYTINRLQMGMKNSQAIFQRAMESILSDLKGVIVYHDDILIYADNSESLEKRLKAVKTRLREKHVTINEAKSIYYSDEMTYLGFRVSARGIEPDGNLVKKS